MSISTADLATCRQVLARGSKSFSFAGRLLPAQMRDRAAAVYAFCRVADDLVDDGHVEGAVEVLSRRLDRIYAAQGLDDAVDRAFAGVVQACGIPRAVPDALIEGFAWDKAGRRYADVSEVRAYGVRVAGTVGVMMALLMDRRDPRALARANDLGVAMQLTNICRDVGEDARMGRLYLPEQDLRRAGVDVEGWLRRPAYVPAVEQAVRRLLDEADDLYERAEAGIAVLPWECRPSIGAAARIYRAIGHVVRTPGFDPVATRAVTSFGHKLALGVSALGFLWARRRPALEAPPLPEAAALIGSVPP